MKNSKVVVIFVVVLVAIFFIFAAVVPAVAPSQPTAVAQSAATDTVPAATAPANSVPTEEAPAQNEAVATESEAASDTGSAGSRKDVIRRLEEAFNQDDSSVIPELFSPDFVGHMPENPLFGTTIDINTMSDLASLLPSALSNLNVESDIIFEEGDLVAQRALITGDFNGEFFDYPPTEGAIAFAANVIYRFDESGKIVEQWIEFDTVTVLQQFGVE
jgi:predicted ester cyclase